MASRKDGPVSDLFTPLRFKTNTSLPAVPELPISAEMSSALAYAPAGSCVGRGIPFVIDDVIPVYERAVLVAIEPTTAQWLVFMHTSDLRYTKPVSVGATEPSQGKGRLAEHAANYVILFDDGTEQYVAIRRLHQVGGFYPAILDKCFDAVAVHRPFPRHAAFEQPASDWGRSNWRVEQPDFVERFTSWLWAWKNPNPGRRIVGARFEPVSGFLLVSAITAGNVSTSPLRWRARRKACLTLPPGCVFRSGLDEDGLLKDIRLDLGQIISATPRSVYPNDSWTKSRINEAPEISASDVLIEYTAHPEARFHLSDGSIVDVSNVEDDHGSGLLSVVPPAHRRVVVRVVDRDTGAPVPAKLHIHGTFGEYLPPVDRHRIINTASFEDSGIDFAPLGHSCSYINGETMVKLPTGKVFIEVSKGFEFRPVRKVYQVDAETDQIVIEIDRVLPWRTNGWVTADTHVHILSPTSALLEGAAEGVNVINLLASQWGEWLTNIGDFDGKTTWGSRESGGDGEYVVRVGTENRQHVLGHISLLGYQGEIITPICSGGPDESALGDPVEVLLSEWARQCRKQGGITVLPHFAHPRAEDAACIVADEVDAVEMRSDPFPYAAMYGGISPYSLVDWYRYLNCGYLVPAVGGTDKVSAAIAVGTIRTYARIPNAELFTYERWLDAIRRGETFVTFGPLMEFSVEGKPMGSRCSISADGGTVDVSWKVASTTIPMSRVELIVNGEIRESVEIQPWEDGGHWSVPIDRSSWLALLVRGHYKTKPEIIAAHSSPVMLDVERSRLMAAADAMTILDQIEGVMMYLDSIGTRAEDAVCKRMKLTLTAAHRVLHNRMHEAGQYHEHLPPSQHREHLDI